MKKNSMNALIFFFWWTKKFIWNRQKVDHDCYIIRNKRIKECECQNIQRTSIEIIKKFFIITINERFEVKAKEISFIILEEKEEAMIGLIFQESVKILISNIVIEKIVDKNALKIACEAFSIPRTYSRGNGAFSGWSLLTDHNFFLYNWNCKIVFLIGAHY